MPTVRRRFAIGSSLAFTFLLALVTPAAADPRGIEVELGGDGTSAGAGEVLTTGVLAPGSAVRGRVLARTGTPGVLTVGVTGVRSDDNGCVEPERRAGDTGCGRGEGELVESAQVTIRRNDGVEWRGGLSELVEQGAPMGRLQPGHDAELEIELGLPSSIGNRAQEDSLTLAFTFRIGSEPHRLAVLGVAGGRGPSVWDPSTASLLAALTAGCGAMLGFRASRRVAP